MRAYGSINSRFWTGSTGRKLKARGWQAQLVATWLMTNRYANMLGLYYCPEIYLQSELAMGIEDIRMGMRWGCDGDFAFFDPKTDVVWVSKFFPWQLSPSDGVIKPRNTQLVKARNMFYALEPSSLLEPFRARYGEILGLTEPHPGEAEGMGIPWGSDGDRGGIRPFSSETDSDSDSEPDTDSDTDTDSEGMSSAAAVDLNLEPELPPIPAASMMNQRNMLAKLTAVVQKRWQVPMILTEHDATDIQKLLRAGAPYEDVMTVWRFYVDSRTKPESISTYWFAKNYNRFSAECVKAGAA